MMKNESITRILLEKEANVHAEDIKSRTPLLYAVKHNKLEQCRLLLQHGERIENKPRRVTKLFNALFRHAKKLNINIFTTDVYGKTLLHRVAENTRIQNAVKCGELLLKNGANINVITRKGDSALHLTADNCSGLPFYELKFEEDADLNICNKKNKTFFDVVIERSEILLEGFIKYLVLAKARGKIDNNFGTVILNTIEFAEYMECQEELNRLKKIQINSTKSFTLWHMIVHDDEKIYRHSVNERLGDIVAEQIKKFPMYIAEIERTYKSDYEK
ncbi:putative ankyrin repeat protein RF_0381 [Harmonia axyridis]|uniref:putative ankyrin repeat protein RF_0381 n=1 Tax=Harmonia axyridis TaxID=115357 RepID=UPI001E2752AB|nr:putative ankyrin repeat protein RF_0381 [Harmonia axyridis]